jgi:hypothetical protein
MPRVRTLAIADRTPPLVAQRLGGCGLETVPILASTPHGFLEPRQILRDPDARIFPKESGDRVRELTARGLYWEESQH